MALLLFWWTFGLSRVVADTLEATEGLWVFFFAVFPAPDVGCGCGLLQLTETARMVNRRVLDNCTAER
jgi:hypothetical protein